MSDRHTVLAYLGLTVISSDHHRCIERPCNGP